MFTGLVEALGTLHKLTRKASSAELILSAPYLANAVAIGDSISINGCCLAVTFIKDGFLTFDILSETLLRTNLGDLTPGASVNLERAIAANAHMGGHFVQGHIDCTTNLLSREEKGADLALHLALPDSFAHYVAFKGSIAVNGVSLTIAAVEPSSFTIWIVPHTRSATNLGQLKPGDRVNLEFDILAKYVERILEAKRAS